MINPHRVHLSEQSGDFWHGDTLHLASPVWDGFSDRKQFIYSYRRPFRRPHSISFGATGVVAVGVKPFSTDAEPQAIANVSVVKGEMMSPRNKYYSYNLSPEHIVAAAEIFDGDIGYEEVAQIGVALAINEYRQDEHTYIWAARQLIEQIRE